MSRCFAAFPITFEEERGWNALIGSLPFIGTLIGAIIGALINIYNTKFYVEKLKANNNRPVPEARLPPMMLGGILFPAGLFIFGWTSSRDIHWIGYFSLVEPSFLTGLVLTDYQTVHWCGPDRMWLPDHIPSIAQLCHRHLPTLRCKCGGSHHNSKELLRRCFPLVCYAE